MRRRISKNCAQRFLESPYTTESFQGVYGGGVFYLSCPQIFIKNAPLHIDIRPGHFEANF